MHLFQRFSLTFLYICVTWLLFISAGFDQLVLLPTVRGEKPCSIRVAEGAVDIWPGTENSLLPRSRTTAGKSDRRARRARREVDDEEEVDGETYPMIDFLCPSPMLWI
jgi:hypothetical protein